MKRILRINRILKTKEILQEVRYYSHTYNIIAVIDYYDENKKVLIEKKNKINKVYDGYIFQLYAQYFALKDNEKEVTSIFLYDISDKTYYPIQLPEENIPLKIEFENLIHKIRNFDIFSFYPKNINKCRKCIYKNLCDRSLYD